MSLARVRNPYLLGATRWAANSSSLRFCGVSEATGSVFFTDGADAVTRVAHPGASAVCPDMASGAFWVVDRAGLLWKYDDDGTVLLTAPVGTDGEAVVAYAGAVAVSGPDGAIIKVESAEVKYQSMLGSAAVGLQSDGVVLYVLTADADLLVLADEVPREAFAPVGTLHLPPCHGMRDMVRDADGIVYVVGTDRLGNGSVVAVDVADATGPVIISIDRALSPFVVLTTDGHGRVGTEEPQNPYSTPEVPWQGRTDSIRAVTVGYLVARPAYGEVWLVGGDVSLLVYDGIPIAYDTDLIIV